MDMCFDHADLENVGSFLTSDASKKSAEKSCEPIVNEVLAFACRPRDVVVQTMPHARERK